MTSSTVTCDGVNVYATVSGVAPQQWDSTLQIVVPPGQVCLFVPTNPRKKKQVLLRPSPDPQPLIITSYNKVQHIVANKTLGTLLFLFTAPTPKLQW